MIKKVKFKDGVVEIHSLEDRGTEGRKEITFSCGEKPAPELPKAFDNLIPVVYEILELPRDWRMGSMKITGVSFSSSETTGVEGAVITFQVDLETSNSPFCGNTPHLPFEQYAAHGNAPTMPEKGQELLKDLRDQARSYLNGKRAQLELAGTR